MANNANDVDVFRSQILAQLSFVRAGPLGGELGGLFRMRLCFLYVPLGLMIHEH